MRMRPPRRPQMTPRGKRSGLDHMPCQCGHPGWRHHPDGRCAKCECRRYKQPVHPEPTTLQPRRNTVKRPPGHAP